MKRIATAILAAACLHGAWAQAEDPEVSAQRARITAARQAAEAKYKAAEKGCWREFAVNDCVGKARAERRQVMADLHRQEGALDDAERKRKAAERQRSLEQRDTARQEKFEREEGEHQSQAAARAQRGAERASSRASQEATAPGKAAKREEDTRKRQAEIASDRARTEEQARARAAEHAKAVEDADKHREALKQRLAEQKKPPAAPLPVPP